MASEALGCDVRAVFFDAVGTMLHPDPPAVEVYASVGRRYGSRLGVGEIAARFAAAFGRQEQLDEEALGRTSEARELAGWRTIVGEVLADVSDPAACFAELFQHFSRPGAWRCEADTAATLQQLVGRGLLLGLASNYDHRLRPVARGLPALAGIAHLVISSEVGWRKPSPHFFAAVCRAVQLPPERILFVGDDLRNDYAGAAEAGMHALLLNSAGRTPAPVATIRTLGELLG